MDPNNVQTIRESLCVSNYVESFRKLLDHKLDPNLQLSDKRSAPLLKYCCNNLEITQLLIDRKADVNTPIRSEFCWFDPICYEDTSSESSDSEPEQRLTTLSFVYNDECIRALLLAKADPTVDVCVESAKSGVSELISVARTLIEDHGRLRRRCRREQARAFLDSATPLGKFFRVFPGLLCFVGRLLLRYYCHQSADAWDKQYCRILQNYRKNTIKPLPTPLMKKN